MFSRSLFVGVPMAASCCFVFLLFCFFNAPKTKPVRSVRMVLSACLTWALACMLMRLQVLPGIFFWFHVSMLGLLLMPVFMCFLLFSILEIKKKWFLSGCVVGTCLMVAANTVSGFFLPPPTVVPMGEQQIGYVFEVSWGSWILITLEIGLLVYVTVLAHYKIKGDKVLSRQLFPLLLGTLSVYVGMVLEIMPGNIFPYGSIGGMLMACCMVYIMYRKYMFDLSQRVIIGGIYTIALIIILLPIRNAAVEIEPYILDGTLRGRVALTLFALVVSAWSLIFVCISRYLAGRMIERRKKEQLELIEIFQTETASLFQQDELYHKIVETAKGIIEDVGVIIFLKKDGEEEFEPVYRDDIGTEVTRIELEQMVELLDSPQLGEHNELALLKYDGQIRGFVYLKIPPKIRLTYIEAECFRQIGVCASVCLKNIDVYQQVYQISIHDDLTGLYNRMYCMEYLKKHWKKDKPMSAIRMDVDDFKLFNELYGQNCGDKILRWCGEMISSVVAESPVFRMGSNEYMVLVDSGDRERILELAEGIRSKIAKVDDDRPKVLQPITLSIGISMYPAMAADEEQLLKQAERATYFAKKNGKNRVEIYEMDDDKESEMQEGMKSYEQIAPTIYALMAAIDAKDSYTFEHSCHVSDYAVLLAKKIGLKQDEIQIVKEAGLLHDIGKIGIPESILTKKARLTEEEYEVMKKHVTNSIEMIHFLPNMSYVIPAVVSHHERYDGKGYPRGLKGKEIPLMGRILAICDSFDAMTTKRCYRDAMPLSYAEGELERSKGKQFDPALTDIFIQLIREGKIAVQET